MDTAGTGLCKATPDPSSCTACPVPRALWHQQQQWRRAPLTLSIRQLKQITQILGNTRESWLAFFFFPPISSALTKGEDKETEVMDFFFCFILLPPSLPPVIWFFTPHLCVFIQLIFVFSFFFFTPLDQLSPHVWHLWLYPSASQCRLAEQHLITGRLWLTGALIMVVGKAQSLPFQQYTLCKKPSTVSQSDKKKSQIPPIIIPSLLYLSTFFSKLSYCGWHQPSGRWGWWDTNLERGRGEQIAIHIGLLSASSPVRACHGFVQQTSCALL